MFWSNRGLPPVPFKYKIGELIYTYSMVFCWFKFSGVYRNNHVLSWRTTHSHQYLHSQAEGYVVLGELFLCFPPLFHCYCALSQAFLIYKSITHSTFRWQLAFTAHSLSWAVIIWIKQSFLALSIKAISPHSLKGLLDVRACGLAFIRTSSLISLTKKLLLTSNSRFYLIFSGA